MLVRLSVDKTSVDAKGMMFQATGAAPGVERDELETLARHLDAGAATRFYRGGPPHGKVVAARTTDDGLWVKIRIRARDAEIWKLIESGAVTTVEIQPLPAGVDVFLKSVAATYPTPAV
jgi:hypothetical protein